MTPTTLSACPENPYSLKRLHEEKLLPSKKPKTTLLANPWFLDFETAPFDIIGTIFKELDSPSFTNCFLVNWHWHKAIKPLCTHLSQLDLKRICDKLTIIDAQLLKNTYEIVIIDEPPIDNFELIKAYRDLASQVENNEGLTLQTVTPELMNTHNYPSPPKTQLTIYQRNFCMDTVDKNHKRLAKKTYRMLMTNNILKNSCNTNCTQKQNLLNQLHCKMPTMRHYTLLCYFNYDLFKKRYYRSEDNNRGHSCTRTFVRQKTQPIVVSFSGNVETPKLLAQSGAQTEPTQVGVGGFRSFH